ncbi:MAG: RNA polymerase subunit sigma-70 [Lachnospiraceae bacterium]|nr:RNA polymerase subunit sigma-70 [Lachnospiraceae bacterium]
MTPEQIEKIGMLRKQGFSYTKVSGILGLSVNTIKSYCQRNDIGGMKMTADPDKHFCKFCGKEVTQNPGRKEKKFCDNKCRMAYWNSHQEEMNTKAVYRYVCPHCGKQFTAYGNANRHYCSRLCYMTARYGYREYWK